MLLFKLSVHFERLGFWSEDNNFTGFFLQNEHDVIEGFVEASFPTPANKLRCIKGLFIDGTELIFITISNPSERPKLTPIAFVFPDISKSGFWDVFSVFRGFFFNDSHRGHAKVIIEEIIDEAEKNELAQNIHNTFCKNFTSSLEMNRYFDDHAQALRYLLNNSKRFPMD